MSGDIAGGGQRSPRAAQAGRRELRAAPPRASLDPGAAARVLTLPKVPGSPGAPPGEPGAPASHRPPPPRAAARAAAPLEEDRADTPPDRLRRAEGLSVEGLPGAGSVLAVIAQPGQESADLGALLAAFVMSGAELAVMCLTRGEGSEQNSTGERLELVRPWELRQAAGLLGVSSVTVADYPDGRLAYLPPGGLAEHIARTAHRIGADLLLVVDPAARADPDTAAVARAASLAARTVGLAVLARTVPGPGRRWLVRLGAAETAARAAQRRALRAHRSQAGALGAAHGQAGALGAALGQGGELVRWLVPPPAGSEPGQAKPVQP